MDVKGEFDFIIVGGGTAGLLIAGRLAAQPDVRVLVIEAGKSNPEHIPEISTPSLAFDLKDSEYDWQYETIVIDKPGIRRTESNIRGKVLGGSSCLNYYTYIRGSCATYDDWEAFSGKEWNYKACKDYFHKPISFHDDEHILNPTPSDIMLNVESSGELDISPTRRIPLAEQLTRAWKSRGYWVNTNPFTGEPGGLIHLLRSIYKGVRSTSACFLRAKQNVTVLSSRLTHRIVINHDVADGIIVKEPDAKTCYYKARREVILCCGVFESPKLLMLSGIGPMCQLLLHGIPCLVDSPHVGKNLQDHPVMAQVFEVKDNLSMDSYLRPGADHDTALLQYRQSRTGPLVSGLLEMAAFARIDDRLKTCKEWREAAEKMDCDPLGPQKQPHFEIDFVGCYARPFHPQLKAPTDGSFLTVIVDLLRPQSRGTVSLRSNDPQEKPVINLNFLAEPVDVAGLREGVRFIDEVLENGDGIRDVIVGEYPLPIPRDSDNDLDRVIQERVTTGYHMSILSATLTPRGAIIDLPITDPCGTCRIGRNIQDRVIDSRLRVYGTKQLRVIDASVKPQIPDARIQSTVYMVAEKGADMIKEDHEDLWPRKPTVWNPLESAAMVLSSIRDVYAENVALWRQAMK